MALKVGIIGAGRMGDRHADAYRYITGAEVVGFADTDIKRADVLARKFGKQSYSIEEILDDNSIDVVHVCTPPSSHAAIAIETLKAGKHTLVEKPMALTLDECDEMINQAKESQVNLMVGHTYRFYPSSIKTKEVLDSGEIGKVRLVLDYGLTPVQLPGKEEVPEWFSKKKSGGGAIFDSIHTVDKLRYWLNSEVQSVFTPILDTIDDSATAEQMGIVVLTFKTGAVATLMPVGPTWGIWDTGCKLVGKKGALYVTYGEEVKVGKKTWRYYDFQHQSGKASYAHNLQGFINEINEFVASIRERRTPSVDGTEGRKNLAIVLAMYDSFAGKKIIDV